jgi:orotate phosphoribosyltransferase
LIQELKDTCYLSGEITLSNGEKSNYYWDIFRLLSDPELLYTTASIMWNLVPYRPDTIASVELGGVILATLMGFFTNTPMIIVRKNIKQHGTKNQIEGVYRKGQKVLLVEDVVTTGRQSESAAAILREAGLIVDDAVCVVDRGAKDLSFRLHSIIGG